MRITYYEVSRYWSFCISELFSFDVSKFYLSVEMSMCHSEAEHQMIDTSQKTS